MLSTVVGVVVVHVYVRTMVRIGVRTMVQLVVVEAVVVQVVPMWYVYQCGTCTRIRTRVTDEERHDSIRDRLATAPHGQRWDALVGPQLP